MPCKTGLSAWNILLLVGFVEYFCNFFYFSNGSIIVDATLQFRAPPADPLQEIEDAAVDGKLGNLNISETVTLVSSGKKHCDNWLFLIVVDKRPFPWRKALT